MGFRDRRGQEPDDTEFCLYWQMIRLPGLQVDGQDDLRADSVQKARDDLLEAPESQMAKQPPRPYDELSV